MEQIDISAHILPRRYFDAVVATAPSGFYMQKRVSAIPVLVDLDARFRVMDRFDDYVEVLSLALPPIEAVAPPGKSAELARIANTELAAIVAKHPDRFVTAVAGLPLNDVKGTLRELDHAVHHLGLRGVQLFTHVNGKPLDARSSCRSSRRWPPSMFRSGYIPPAAPFPLTIPMRPNRSTKSGTCSGGPLIRQSR